MPPVVSVVIPAHNAAAFVGQAVESVLVQDYVSKEIIVVDDGSTDDTRAVLERFAGRVKIIHQTNAGPAVARNRGVRESRGEYIAFLDADDLWIGDKLAQQVRCLEENPDIHLVYHNWYVAVFGSREETDLLARIGEGARTDSADDYRVCEQGWLYNKLLLDSVLCTDTVMMRRSLFETLGGFDETLPQGQDYDLWLRASRLTAIAKLDARLAVVRIRGGSITTTPRPVNYRARIVQKTLDKWGYRGPDGRLTEVAMVRRVLAQNWFEFGYAHLCHGDSRIAIGGFRRAIALQPGRVKAWINLLRACLKYLLGVVLKRR